MYEDPSYAAYVMIEEGGLARCKRYYNCEIVQVPYIIDRSMGSGWVFPKDSPYFPIFEYYASILNLGGIYKRISQSYEQHTGQEQVCTDYDGQPIGLYKCFSLFGILLVGLLLSGIIFV